MKLLLVLAFVGSALACSRNSNCPASQYCKSGASGAAAGICTNDEDAGGSCSSFDLQEFFDDNVDMCSGSLQCLSSTCTQPAQLGGTCGSNYGATPCVDSLVCSDYYASTDGGTCMQKVAMGGACSDTNSLQKQCADGYYCSSATGSSPYAAGTCDAKIADGGACVNDVQCAGGLVSCSEGKCTDIGAAFGAAVGAGLAMAGGLLAAIVIIPIVVCICCVVVVYMMMKKKKSSDDD